VFTGPERLVLMGVMRCRNTFSGRSLDDPGICGSSDSEKIMTFSLYSTIKGSLYALNSYGDSLESDALHTMWGCVDKVTRTRILDRHGGHLVLP
jgi:hypothetical protein